ncbi:hypothetical protein SAMN05216327_11853 [Dyadobacter sp. SG02]|nr:hypothetical protein SAMN05216327_11853 [Dyadobacter sp. SG02]
MKMLSYDNIFIIFKAPMALGPGDRPDYSISTSFLMADRKSISLKKTRDYPEFEESLNKIIVEYGFRTTASAVRFAVEQFYRIKQERDNLATTNGVLQQQLIEASDVKSKVRGVLEYFLRN